jgi:hypothetical protein
MPTIKTTVDDGIYADLVALRKAEGLPSVSALFLHKCGVLTDQKEAAEIVKRAITLAAKRSGKPKYKLKDLFPKPQWELFSKSSRLLAGKMFNAKISASNIGIVALAKSSSNHQFYLTR